MTRFYALDQHHGNDNDAKNNKHTKRLRELTDMNLHLYCSHRVSNPSHYSCLALSWEADQQMTRVLHTMMALSRSSHWGYALFAEVAACASGQAHNLTVVPSVENQIYHYNVTLTLNTTNLPRFLHRNAKLSILSTVSINMQELFNKFKSRSIYFIYISDASFPVGTSPWKVVVAEMSPGCPTLPLNAPSPSYPPRSYLQYIPLLSLSWMLVVFPSFCFLLPHFYILPLPNYHHASLPHDQTTLRYFL